jgi:hypothetical protein
MKLPKPAPSVPAILAEQGKDLSFLFQRSKPAVRDLLDRASEESWNYESSG